MEGKDQQFGEWTWLSEDQPKLVILDDLEINLDKDSGAKP